MHEKQQKQDIYEQITGAIIAAIEEGAPTYEMPWHTLATPINAATRKAYRGINTLTLWCIGRKRCYATQEWATYRQWSEMGAQVRRGERSASVVFWKFLESSDDAVEEVQESTANSRRIPLAREYHVFNAAQVEGYVPQPEVRLAESERIDHAERFFRALPGVVRHGGDRAFYSPATDEIQIPAFEQFKSAAAYYSTLAHEHTHWSGASRLSATIDSENRDEAVAADARGDPPALLTRTSNLPKRDTASATTASASSATRRSASTNQAVRRRPSGPVASGTSPAAGRWRPQVTTSAPAARKARTTPRPMPRLPPVTTTTDPV